ncbi:Myosin-IB [Hondaea fermentalgiana]|uniref:Myosin-IB n=1 Tax=Hondaea fermentalgiana TaxID=2315210 RepID=A0A2R5GC60_9STRA|nr:Myosin-IB [Hondaea fermentalgiana]|eukprot:GBG25741.1 Myosin-IB [Hondaea fermentalgiana]
MSDALRVRVESDVWIPACKGNEREVYELAKVLSMDDEAKTCTVKASSGPKLQLSIDDLQLTNPRVVPDMTSLYHINDAGILHNLKVRSEKDLPYTMMGSVLVSVNPLHAVRDPDVGPNKVLPADVPHPYSISENAFKNMTFSYERKMQVTRQLEIMSRAGQDVSSMGDIELVVNQSVVISGESGSGKTEAGKRVLSHLVTRTCSNESNNSKLDVQLAGVGPILEGFGNASTVCNHNSSRFGKFSKLHFLQTSQERGRGRSWDLVGATAETYLLEKSRVVNHSNGERNFHVFYQLINGADDALRKRLELPAKVQDARKFRYLTPGMLAQSTDASAGAAAGKSVGGAGGRARGRRGAGAAPSSAPSKGGMTKTMTVSNERYFEPQILEKDKRNFGFLLQALADIGKTPTEIDELLSVVGGILHLGNISFVNDEATSDDAARVADDGKAALHKSASLLGVNEADLLTLLLEKEVKAGLEVIKSRLDTTSAQYGRDALAKWTYGIIFDWLVHEINAVLMSSYTADTPLEEIPFIGVLDIFGFESFAKNGFEQLLINYTNESLQSTFNYQVFVAEADLYKQEGLILAGEPFACPADDGACLDLFEGKPGTAGLLMEIDSESRAPKPSDDKMNRRLHQCFGKEKSFPKPHPKDLAKKFLVSHYAGVVEYTVGDFVEKNNDRIPAKMHALMRVASNSVVCSAFERCADSGSSKAKKTVVANFGRQIRGLVDTLESTKCSFIRCVKPNPEMKYAPGTNWFNNQYVAEQLKCLSIPQTAAVLKSGFPTRIEYDSIVSAYQTALPPDALQVWQRANENGNKQNGRTFVCALFWAFKVPQEAYRLGLSRVFFSSGMIDLLDRIMKEAAAWAQDEGKESEEKIEVGRRFKLYYARLRWRRCAAKVIACNKFLAVLKASRARGNAARVAQAAVRSFLFRLVISKRIEKRLEAKRAAERKAREAAERKAREEAEQKRREALKEGKVSREEAAEVFSQSAQHHGAPPSGPSKPSKDSNLRGKKPGLAIDAGSSKNMPPLKTPTETGAKARQRYRSAKRISGGWNLSGALRTPRGSLNPDFLELVDMAQQGIKKENQELRDQNERLRSDLEELKADLILLRKATTPFQHVLHIV